MLLLTAVISSDLIVHGISQNGGHAESCFLGQAARIVGAMMVAVIAVWLPIDPQLR